MATATNQDQLNEVTDELVRSIQDALLAALGTINIGEEQRIGLLAAIDDLATAPIGDLQALLARLTLANVAGRDTLGDGPRLLLQGAGGVAGVANYLPSSEDLGAQVNGLWAFRSNELPPDATDLGETWGSVFINKRTSHIGSGFVHGIGNRIKFFRILDGKVDDVVTAYTTGNLLSAVRFTNGVPSGGAFEYVENASGRYLKLADGTLICTVQTILDYGTNNWQHFSLPHEFVGALPTATIGFSDGAGSFSARRKAVSILLPDLVSGRLLYNTTGTTLEREEGLTENVTVTAFGRWYEEQQ